MRTAIVIGILSIFVVGCSSEPEESTNNVVTVCSALECADAGVDATIEPDATVDAAPDEDVTTAVDMGGAEDMPAALMATESYERDVLYGWVVAGQPSQMRVAEIVASGAMIISLRLESEDPYDEPALIDSLSGDFTRYPTTSADYDDMAFREGMYDLYDAQLDAGRVVYLHCASGNRAGASWALYQAERKGVDAEEAIAMGKAAGLGSLETRVRQLLGL